MRTTSTQHQNSFQQSFKRNQRGVSLIELIVFMVVVSIAFAALISVYVQSAFNNVDPIIQVRLLEAAQSKLDEVMALKYDEATPTSGVPACGTGVSPACTSTTDANMNDVDDFNGITDPPYLNYSRTVTVEIQGNRKRITVSVNVPNNQTVALSAFRYNF